MVLINFLCVEKNLKRRQQRRTFAKEDATGTRNSCLGLVLKSGCFELI